MVSLFLPQDCECLQDRAAVLLVFCESPAACGAMLYVWEPRGGMRGRKEPEDPGSSGCSLLKGDGGSQDGSVCKRLSLGCPWSQRSQTTVRGESDPRKEGRMEIPRVWWCSVRADSRPGLTRLALAEVRNTVACSPNLHVSIGSHPLSCWDCASQWLSAESLWDSFSQRKPSSQFMHLPEGIHHPVTGQ